jgi:transcriptional regulator with XRE-family HTH domain
MMIGGANDVASGGGPMKQSWSGRLGSGEFGQFIGGRLRQERRLAGTTREVLGKALRVGAETIENYESGEQPLRAQQLAAASAALGVPVSALFYEGMRRAAPTETRKDHDRWLAIRRPLKFLYRSDFAQLAPLLILWQESRGEFSAEVDCALSAGDILERAILVRRSPDSSRLETEHFGAKFMFLRPSDIVGREFQAQPDREYAAWMIEAYEQLLDRPELELQVEACRAVIRAWDNRTICARYDRVLIPWRRRGSDQFLMCIALRRGEPAAVPSDTDALSP